MKRTVMLTTALMFAGMTSLSLAHENMNSGKSVPSVESKPAAGAVPAAAKPAANVESAKQPVASHSKSEVLPSKEGTAASQKMAQGSPAVTGKTEKKETSSVATTANSKEKKAEQKPNEAQTTTVESAKQPMASHSKNEVLPNKEGTPSQNVVQGSPAVTGKTEKKETSSVATTANSKEKKAEQKPNEAQTTTNPTK